MRCVDSVYARQRERVVPALREDETGRWTRNCHEVETDSETGRASGSSQ
jgi:hypothetical protein